MLEGNQEALVPAPSQPLRGSPSPVDTGEG